MANQQNQILDLSDFLDMEIAKSEKKLKKKSETKTGKKKTYNKPDSNRFQDEDAQVYTLNKGNKTQKVQETLTNPLSFLKNKTKKALDFYKTSNKRIRFHKERIEIIKSELKKYIKIGNSEAIEKCNLELERLQQDYKKTIDAFEQTKKEDYENFNDKVDIKEIKDEIKSIKIQIEKASENLDSEKIISLQEKLKEYNHKLEESENHNMWLDEKKEVLNKLKIINEKIRTSNFSSISRILTNIKEDLKIIENSKKSKDYESLEDLLNSYDNESLEEIENEINEDIDSYESEYLMQLSEICKLPIYERIEELAKLIYSILPKKYKLKYSLKNIQTLIETNNQKTIKEIINQFKDTEELESLKEQKEELETNLNGLNSKLKKNQNIIDFIFGYLEYDNSTKEEQLESRNILIQYSLIWSEKIVNRLVNQYNLYAKDKDLIEDLIAQSALIITEKVDVWLENKQKGSKQEWFNFIAPTLRQLLINYIIEWNNHGTISGTNARDINFKNKKKIESIKASLQKEHGINKLTGKLDEIWEDYAEFLIGKNELLGIESASDREAIIGGNSGDEQKIDYVDYSSKIDLDPIEKGEALLIQDELIKNMSILLSLFDNNEKTGKKEKVFTDEEILVIKLELGILYNEKTGKEYDGDEKAEIISRFRKQRGLKKRFTNDSMTYSNYSTIKKNVFGNAIEHSAYLEKVKRYEKGLGPKPSDKAKNQTLFEGKLIRILKSRPELLKAFADLREYIRTTHVRELSLTETDLNSAIENARLNVSNENQDTEFVNTVVNLDLILGDTNYSDDSFTDIWSEMIDFTGLNI